MNNNNKINIAIDAMGGDDSPHKIIEGIKISLKSSKENFFFLYGNENILQKRIIKHCKINGTEVYVATNLLESMIDKSTPTRAEVNDVYTTLSTGADGLVLAAETAIGANPIDCTNMIVKLINSFEADENKKFDDEYKDLLNKYELGDSIFFIGNKINNNG